MINALKIIKSQEMSKSNNVNDNYLLKSDYSKNKDKSIYYDKDSESQDNKNHIKNNKTESNFRILQNNDNKYYNKTIRENKEINNEYNKTEGIITKYKQNGTSKRYKIKSIERALGLKSSKPNSKSKGGILKNLYSNTYDNEEEDDIINTKSFLVYENNSKNKEKIIEEYKQNPRNDYKYRTFSGIKSHFYKKYYQEENNNLINNEEYKRNNKINLNKKIEEKEKKEKKKYVIHLINSDNLKNAKTNINNNINIHNLNDSDENNLYEFNIKEEKKDNDNNNIAIKLMKNKKQMVDEFNLNYIKQCSPTLNLYKNYYNKKMVENKEKERLKEKLKTPQKILPAFGRTAYTEFIKPNNKINLKRHNANANIVINKNFKNFIQDRKYFYTLNKENTVFDIVYRQTSSSVTPKFCKIWCHPSDNVVRHPKFSIVFLFKFRLNL